MTEPSSREDLIEEAAKAIWEESTDPGRKGYWEDESEYVADEYANQARAALALFEQAHAPTSDEREALIEVIDPALDGSHPLDDKVIVAGEDTAYYADRILAAGFRRTVQGEPTDEREALRDAFDEMHRITEGGCDTRGEDVADMVTALGFRRAEQGEPTDAQVEDACTAFYEHATGLTSWARLVEYDAVLADRYRDGIRRALRAAAAAREEGQS